MDVEIPQINTILDSRINSILCEAFLQYCEKDIDLRAPMKGTLFELIRDIEQSAESYRDPRMIRLRHILFKRSFDFCIATFDPSKLQSGDTSKKFDVSTTRYGHRALVLTISFTSNNFSYRTRTITGFQYPLSLLEHFDQDDIKALGYDFSSDHMSLDLNYNYKAVIRVSDQSHTIKIIDIANKCCIRNLEGHTAPVVHMQKITDYCFLTASDNEIKIWNIDPLLSPLQIILINALKKLSKPIELHTVHEDWQRVFEIIPEEMETAKTLVQ